MYIDFSQSEAVSLELGKDQTGVCAAKAKAVGQGDVNLLFLAHVADKVKVGADIRASKVECWWDDVLKS